MLLLQNKRAMILQENEEIESKDYLDCESMPELENISDVECPKETTFRSLGGHSTLKSKKREGMRNNVRTFSTPDASFKIRLLM